MVDDYRKQAIERSEQVENALNIIEQALGHINVDDDFVDRIIKILDSGSTISIDDFVNAMDEEQRAMLEGTLHTLH